MRKTALGVFAALLALWPALCWAVDLVSAKVDEDGKKLHLTLALSEPAAAQVISNYQGNFVSISISGLVIPRDLLKRERQPADDAATAFWRSLRFMQNKGEGQIRLYLGKLATPADVQVVQLEKSIELELVKPTWKLDTPVTDQAPTDTGAAEEPAGPAPSDSTPAAPEDVGGFRDDQPTEDSAPAPLDETESQPQQAPPQSEPEQPGMDEAGGQPPSDGSETYGQTSFDEIFGPAGPSATVEPAEDEPAEEPQQAHPAADFSPQPSYQRFDLDNVLVSQLEIKGLPFDEALLKLVADSGFNVVVGEDVDETEVNLSFTHKQLSLKSALDLLCIAYDLQYSIEDDAIVIRHK
jgi:hypothetical protein